MANVVMRIFLWLLVELINKFDAAYLSSGVLNRNHNSR